MTSSVLDFDVLRDLIFRGSGRVISPERREFAEAQLSHLANRRGMTSAAELLSALRSSEDNRLQRGVIRALTTSPSRIGYATPLGDLLRSTVIPGLMRQPKADRCIRVLCANCGARSPIGIAMLLHEGLRPRAAWPVRILATDRSPAVIERMCNLSFGEPEISREIPPAVRDRYFLPRGSEWQLCEELRGMIEFQILDLAAPPPMDSGFDLILLGGTLPYYENPVRRQILSWVQRLLSSDGYLLLEEGETNDDADLTNGWSGVGKPGIYRPHKSREIKEIHGRAEV